MVSLNSLHEIAEKVLRAINILNSTKVEKFTLISRVPNECQTLMIKKILNFALCLQRLIRPLLGITCPYIFSDFFFQLLSNTVHMEQGDELF